MSCLLTPGLRFMIFSSAAFSTPSCVNSTFGFPCSPSTLTFLKYLRSNVPYDPWTVTGLHHIHKLTVCTLDYRREWWRQGARIIRNRHVILPRTKNRTNLLITHTIHNTYIHTHIHIYIYIHAFIYTHTYTHTYMHTYIHTNIHTYKHTFVHSYIYIHNIHTYIHNTYIHTYPHTNIHTYMYTYIYNTYIHTYIPTYKHTYIHTYIYTYKHIYIAYAYCLPKQFVIFVCTKDFLRTLEAE